MVGIILGNGMINLKNYYNMHNEITGKSSIDYIIVVYHSCLVLLGRMFWVRWNHLEMQCVLRNLQPNYPWQMYQRNNQKLQSLYRYNILLKLLIYFSTDQRNMLQRLFRLLEKNFLIYLSDLCSFSLFTKRKVYRGTQLQEI